jgi:quercetin dioxygenase-like cupin family protein
MTSLKVDSFQSEIAATNKINALIEAIRPDKIELPVPTHRFAAGLFSREITIPAGTLIVGKKHLYSHFVVILTGRIAIYSDDDTVNEYAAGDVIVSGSTQRAVIAIENTRVMNIHANPDNLTDIDEIESILISPECLFLDKKIYGVVQ